MAKKNIIPWSMIKMDWESCEGQEYYMKWGAVALLTTEGEDFCIAAADDISINYFDTEAAARQFIEQLQKYWYYGFYGNNYELQYFDPLSPEFLKLLGKRINYMCILADALEKAEEYLARPFYRKMFDRFIYEPVQNLIGWLRSKLDILA